MTEQMNSPAIRKASTDHFIAWAGSIALASTLVATSFWWQGHRGLNLWDEGYLWYGVQRVMTGETPLLDFMAYDPGRYYWSAFLLYVMHADGIIALRLTIAIFQVAGLSCALWLITSKQSSLGQKVVFALIGGGMCLLWMFPRHKLFDTSISIILIANLSWLISHPTPARFFWSGVCTGLIAFFGRNHGVYGFAASLIIFLWFYLGTTEEVCCFRSLGLWVLGLCAGFTPMVAMCFGIPGFTTAFIDSIRFLFEQKATNLPIPVPWPWLVDFLTLSVGAGARATLVGLFFIGIVMFGVTSLAWSFWRKMNGQHVSVVLLASASLALPYAHFAYSRADVGHLAQGIFPFLIGCLVMLSTQRAIWKWAGVAVLAGASFLVMFEIHPGWICREGQPCETVSVSGSQLVIDAATARDIELLAGLVDEYASQGESFIATPVWPGAYALFNRRSPMWAIYALWTRSNDAQEKDIERIKKAQPRFAIIFDLALDGRDELRFENTNPLIDRFIRQNFVPLLGAENPAYKIFRAKDNPKE